MATEEYSNVESHGKGVVYLGISPLPERHHFLHIERQNPLGVVPLRKVSHLTIKRTLNAVGVCADPFPHSCAALCLDWRVPFIAQFLGSLVSNFQIDFRNPRRSVNIPFTGCFFGLRYRA